MADAIDNGDMRPDNGDMRPADPRASNGSSGRGSQCGERCRSGNGYSFWLQAAHTLPFRKIRLR